MMYGYYNGYYPFHLFGSIFMVLFWIIVLIAIVRLMRHSRGGHGHWGECNHGANPADILKERYAKGEITKEQFEQMKKDIQ